MIIFTSNSEKSGKVPVSEFKSPNKRMSPVSVKSANILEIISKAMLARVELTGLK